MKTDKKLRIGKLNFILLITITKIVNTFWTITLLFSRAFILEKNLLFKVDFLFCY